VTAPGLPPRISACLFDLDGVITRTADLHARAWRAMFDDFLQRRSAATGEPFVPFDLDNDYRDYVDGRPRVDGARAFLESRHIVVAQGSETDPPTADTVIGLSRRKDALFLELLKSEGVVVYEDAARYLQRLRSAGVPRAVVSASRHTSAVLAAAKLDQAFDAQVDGVVAEQQHLAGKPAPDTYLEAARRLGVAPAHAAVFEDALAGVAAGRAGHFGFVVGLDRSGTAREALAAHGAHVVVADFDELMGQPTASAR